MDKLSRDELIAMVSNIMEAEGTDEEIAQWIVQLKANVPHPAVTDLIFYPEEGDLSAEEVVDKALAYQPIRLGGTVQLG